MANHLAAIKMAEFEEETKHIFPQADKENYILLSKDLGDLIEKRKKYHIKADIHSLFLEEDPEKAQEITYALPGVTKQDLELIKNSKDSAVCEVRSTTSLSEVFQKEIREAEQIASALKNTATYTKNIDISTLGTQKKEDEAIDTALKNTATFIRNIDTTALVTQKTDDEPGEKLERAMRNISSRIRAIDVNAL